MRPGLTAGALGPCIVSLNMMYFAKDCLQDFFACYSKFLRKIVSCEFFAKKLFWFLRFFSFFYRVVETRWLVWQVLNGPSSQKQCWQTGPLTSSMCA